MTPSSAPNSDPQPPRLPAADLAQFRVQQAAYRALDSQCAQEFVNTLKQGASLADFSSASLTRAGALLTGFLLEAVLEDGLKAQRWEDKRFVLRILKAQVEPIVVQQIVNAPTARGRISILGQAIIDQAPGEIVEQLLGLGAAPSATCSLITSQDEQGRALETAHESSLLQLALRCRQYEAAHLLLRQGASVRHKDSLGDSSIHCLFHNGSALTGEGLLLLENLLARGASAFEPNARGQRPWERMLQAQDVESLRTCAHRYSSANAQNGVGAAFSSLARFVELESPRALTAADCQPLPGLLDTARIARLLTRQKLLDWRDLHDAKLSLPELLLPERTPLLERVLESVTPRLEVLGQRELHAYEAALLACTGLATGEREIGQKVTALLLAQAGIAQERRAIAAQLLPKIANLAWSFNLWKEESKAIPVYRVDTLEFGPRPSFLEHLGFLPQAAQPPWGEFKVREYQQLPTSYLATSAITRLGPWRVELSEFVASISNPSFGLLLLPNPQVTSQPSASPVARFFEHSAYWADTRGGTHLLADGFINQRREHASVTEGLVPVLSAYTFETPARMNALRTLVDAFSGILFDIGRRKLNTLDSSQTLAGRRCDSFFSESFSFLLSAWEAQVATAGPQGKGLPLLSFSPFEGSPLRSLSFTNSEGQQRRTLLVDHQVMRALRSLGEVQWNDSELQRCGLAQFLLQAGFAQRGQLVWGRKE